MNLPTYEEIKPYIDSGMISACEHPENPDVQIFNYTQRCQFAGEWNDITRQCRGLIMNVKTGEILARPFPKFFNYQEHVAKGWEIPNEKPIITEKLDGSLGILYALNGKPWIATRGSFKSDQAIWATKWWRENVNALPEPGVTHLFEIIYPENRIVVSYDFSGLVWLCALSNENGHRYMISSSWWDKIRCVNYHHQLWDSLDQLAQMDVPNAEGFVCFFPTANLRIKMKFAEYVRLHKIVTGVSEIGIWEMLRDGNSLDDLLEKVPDEFFAWVQSVEKRLRGAWAELWGRAQLARQMVQGKPTRKEQAIEIMEKYRDVSGATFALLDGKDREAVLMIWKLVRPHGQKVFKHDIDQ